MTIIDTLARKVLLSRLPDVQGGTLNLLNESGLSRYGDRTRRTWKPGTDPLDATIVVHDDAFYRRALLGSDVGIGESYMAGEWSSPDLVTLTRLMIRNAALIEQKGGVLRDVVRFVGSVTRRLRDNSLTGSRKHIREHYDLGNDFFRLFLDGQHLMYSSAYYETGRETLEQAQGKKLDAICRKLNLGPGDHVLEIGTGWGGFAVWAATRYGCRVTTTTISEEQYRHACDWASRLGDAGSRITVLLTDYRQLEGQFDKVVSIEMFEAVGLNHYDEYFSAVERLLKPSGSMLMQAITVDEQHFPHYHGQPDWIEKYIFPGGELASIGKILESLARVTSMSLYHAENFGTHYARTLREWRGRYHAELERVRALGFPNQFLRMWDLYFAFCEAAFLERHTGVFQIVLNKNYSGTLHFNEPWGCVADDATAAVA